MHENLHSIIELYLLNDLRARKNTVQVEPVPLEDNPLNKQFTCRFDCFFKFSKFDHEIFDVGIGLKDIQSDGKFEDLDGGDIEATLEEWLIELKRLQKTNLIIKKAAPAELL